MGRAGHTLCQARADDVRQLSLVSAVVIAARLGRRLAVQELRELFVHHSPDLGRQLGRLDGVCKRHERVVELRVGLVQCKARLQGAQSQEEFLCGSK
jgi:hypothetical protein